MSFVHQIRVRYGDCDIQGVVFNATYFAYLDDTLDVWLRTTLGADYLDRFEYLVKKATMDWSSPATAHEVIDLRPTVTRWGRTSFDVHVRLEVGSRLVGEAAFVLVSITPKTHEPTPIPDEVRQALSSS